jgi:hypothetical protein
MIDLSWRALGIEVLGRIWLVLAMFACGQAVLLRRMVPPTDGATIVLVVGASTAASLIAAIWLYTAPLGLLIASFVSQHVWILGVAASVLGFVATTLGWLASQRLGPVRQNPPSA